MGQVNVIDSLKNIINNIIAPTKELQASLVALRHKIETSLTTQDITQDIFRNLTISNTDFYITNNIDNAVSDKGGRTGTESNLTRGNLKAYVRDVPVISRTIDGSQPAWAVGSSPIETLGPFLSIDGRQLWYDFYSVERLVALYFQGQAKPAILFKASFKHSILDFILHRPDAITKNFTVVTGSVWIYAPLLTAGAPAGATAPLDRYVGIKVKGGTITLDVLPTLQSNQVTLTVATTLTVALQPDQKVDANAANTSPYGKDARDAAYTLPDAFSFSLKSNGKIITAIAQAKANIYGQPLNFTWQKSQDVEYNAVLNCVSIPVVADSPTFAVRNCESPYWHISGKAALEKSWWTLPAAVLDIANPGVAEGNGGVVLLCGSGMSTDWTGLDDSDVIFRHPFILGEPGALTVSDLISLGLGASQHMELWSNTVKSATTVDLFYLAKAVTIYTSTSIGEEVILSSCNANFNIDRPIKVNGEPFAVRGKACTLMLAINNVRRLVYILDTHLLADNKPPNDKTPPAKPVAIALENALFTVSPVTEVLLFGECDENWKKVTKANLFLSFGLYTYIPTLPDPYIANLKIFEQLYNRSTNAFTGGFGVPLLTLLCVVTFEGTGEGADTIDSAFHFGDADLQNAATTSIPVVTATQTTTSTSKPASTAIPDVAAKTASQTQGIVAAQSTVKNFNELFAQQVGNTETLASIASTALPAPAPNVDNKAAIAFMAIETPPDYQKSWDGNFSAFNTDAFALLDVSSKANQMGVSFGYFGSTRMAMVQTTGMLATGDNTMAATNLASNNIFPFIIQGMEVKASSLLVRSFTLPQIAWEPLYNLSSPDRTNPLDPNSPKLQMDPERGWHYFANDGGPTRIFNNSLAPVALSPIPVVASLIKDFKTNPKNFTLSLSTLPFGLRTLSFISRNFVETKKPDIVNKQPTFRDNLTGGIQLSLYAGDYGKTVISAADKDSPMFPGYTIQVNNLRDSSGSVTNESTLGQRVTEIFNNEFFTTPLAHGSGKPFPDSLKETRGVPVSRIDITGYGANTFSNWLSPTAALAQTSQSEFQILMGRTAHEVIQVKSILYPWGIKVVRTITLYRVSSGYVYRTDSGWVRQSDGLFDFSYNYVDIGNNPKTVDAPYEYHPGLISGLFNVRNIKDALGVADFTSTNQINAGQVYLNGLLGKEEKNTGAAFTEDVKCGAVYFDSDFEIQDVVQGHINKRVVSKKVLGYVQLAPAGKPLTPQQLRALLALQGGAIGGDIDCVIDLNRSGQQMRIHRCDVNTSLDKTGNPIFVVATRGNVNLPKEGSWSMVQHAVGTGEVTPLPEGVTVPVIRVGKWIKDGVINPTDVANNLLRIANPLDIVRDVQNSTINFGMLQNTATQKALFLTPAFGLAITKLLSKTPPIFSDAYRLMTGSGIFPNIGKADGTDFGKAMQLLNIADSAGNTAQAFASNALKDGGKQVFELLEVQAQKAGAEAVQQGFKLLKDKANNLIDDVVNFEVPNFDIPLIDTDGLKIYIQYKTDSSTKAKSRLNFDINSKIGDVAEAEAEKWKGRLNNVSMVIDLGSMKSLMTIKGNFNSADHAESSYEGSGDDTDGLPTPQIEFSDALKPVIAILEILADLSTGNYADAMKRGLQVAMSNSSDAVWEYKFSADKEIPLIHFPPTEELYNSAQTPLKLEASLGIGVSFDAALRITTDPKKLLPTAGAFLKFHGGLSVMCVSVGVGSIYAVGAVDVKIGCDTQGGPSLDLAFGFGVSIVVSLPVVGNVSVTFMAGVKMHADTGDIKVTAFLLFKGQAELLGGLVGITIMIEASGTIERNIALSRTDCTAEVTFAIDISIFLIIDISFSKSWSESKQIA